MKWVNHEIVTGVIVYGATGDFLATAFSMAGAIFPDKVEGKPGANYWSWRARHRGWSHWPVIYIAILAIMQMGLLPQGADVERGATFICIGALLHIAEVTDIRREIEFKIKIQIIDKNISLHTKRKLSACDCKQPLYTLPVHRSPW